MLHFVKSFCRTPCTYFKPRVANLLRTLGTLITRNTVGPMVGVKVSKEGSTMVNSVNTVSLGINEHAMKSGREGIRKGYILHRHYCSQPTKKNNNKNKKLEHLYLYKSDLYWYRQCKERQRATCTGTTLTCTGTAGRILGN